MDALFGLLNLLTEEFQNFDDLRISPVFPSTTTRAPDLEQDYDPESNRLHIDSGVRVRTKTREYFFPTDWYAEIGRKQLHDQIEEIREQIRSFSD